MGTSLCVILVEFVVLLTDASPNFQALGCTLYELCALHKPFEASNMPAIIFGIMRNRPPPLPLEYSEDLRGMVAWLMQARTEAWVLRT